MEKKWSKYFYCFVVEIFTLIVGEEFFVNGVKTETQHTSIKQGSLEGLKGKNHRWVIKNKDNALNWKRNHKKISLWSIKQLSRPTWRNCYWAAGVAECWYEKIAMFSIFSIVLRRFVAIL